MDDELTRQTSISVTSGTMGCRGLYNHLYGSTLFVARSAVSGDRHVGRCHYRSPYKSATDRYHHETLAVQYLNVHNTRKTSALGFSCQYRQSSNNSTSFPARSILINNHRDLNSSLLSVYNRPPPSRARTPPHTSTPRHCSFASSDV